MKENRDLYARLRRQYPLFVYEGYEELPLQAEAAVYSAHVRYRFVVYDDGGKEAFVFRPEWRVPKRPFYAAGNVPPALWRNLLFQLGLAELVSYWKATASPVVEIRCPDGVCLDEAAVAFWQKLYFNGLGEYFSYRHWTSGSSGTEGFSISAGFSNQKRKGRNNT